MKTKPIKIVRRNFLQIGRIQKDWDGTMGRAVWEDRTIYIHNNLPAKTRWSEPVMLGHELAHFLIFDAEADDFFDDEQTELFCDWYSLALVPDKKLHTNERYFKNWMLKGWRPGTSKKRFLVGRACDLLGFKAKKKAKVLKKFERVLN